jgi:serine protease Do
MFLSKIIISFAVVFCLVDCAAEDFSEVDVDQNVLSAADNEKKEKKLPVVVNKKKGKKFFDFTEIVENVMGSVVSIVAQQNQNESADEEELRKFGGLPLDDFFRNLIEGARQRKVTVAGSGFFIHIDSNYAYVATNSHIVENSTKARVLLVDKTEFPAQVHGVDARSDLAVLKIDMKNVPENKRNLIKPLTWGDSDKTKVGQWVIAVGNPFGLGNSVTIGVVSAKSRDLHLGGSALHDDFIQHSAQINVGNSGGCLINTDGEVIGINTVIITPSGGNVGIGFAIPAKNARNVCSQLIEKQRIQRGALGVSVQDFTKESAEALNSRYEGGATIARVDEDGPAFRAGLKIGDVIVKFDDVEITGMNKLSRVVGEATIDSLHKVKILRHGKEIDLEVKLGDFDKMNGIERKSDGTQGSDSDKKSEEIVKFFGMSLMDASKVKTLDGSGAKKNGVLVLNVDANGPADDVGIARGDVIEEVNQQVVNSAVEFKKIIFASAKSGKRAVFLRLRRDENVRFLSLIIDDEESLKKFTDGAEEKNKKKEKSDTSKDADSQKSSGSEEDNSSQDASVSPNVQKGLGEKFKNGLSKFNGLVEGFFKKKNSGGNFYS